MSILFTMNCTITMEDTARALVKFPLVLASRILSLFKGQPRVFDGGIVQ
jgi:hypothetical protein